MASPDKARQDAQPAFVLHRYPFRETSLVVETFTRGHGRVPLIARGARRSKSILRGVLLSFQPLLLSWTGKTELRTLTRAEWEGAYAPLKGQSLICGFYLNELLLKLLPRDDPHERLFTIYQEALAMLGGQHEKEAILRRFEINLLRELGYAVMLDRDVENDEPVRSGRSYIYVIELGPMPAKLGAGRNGVELTGQTLLDMHAGDYANAATQQQSKMLMRALINHYLSDQVLHSRQLLRDLQGL